MAKIRMKIGLLLIFLILVIIGFVYLLYYAQEDDTKEGILVEYRLPEMQGYSREVSL